MPASTEKRRKKTAAQAASSNKGERLLFTRLILAAAAGAVLGLSAPGFGLWFLAWVGLAPLLLIAVSSQSIGGAFLIGLAFSTAYHLVYLNWYLALHPLTWLGFTPWQSGALACAAWILVCLHQGVITGLFAALIRALPMIGGFLPARSGDSWRLPAYLVVPLAWVLLENKIGNAHDLLGVPWAMVEYSQFKLLPLVQVSSIVGGIGLGFLIVMVNAVVASLIATVSRKLDWSGLAARTTGDAIRHVLIAALVLAVSCLWGSTVPARRQKAPSLAVAVVQSNVNIDMQKTEHRYTLKELIERAAKMIAASQGKLCILSENSIPAYLRTDGYAAPALSRLAQQLNVDLVVGSVDKDASGRPYNSAFAVSRFGKLLDNAYHKRYLVPFGEYTPYLVHYLPEWVKRLTNTPAGGGFAAGDQPVILELPATESSAQASKASENLGGAASSLRHAGPGQASRVGEPRAQRPKPHGGAGGRGEPASLRSNLRMRTGIADATEPAGDGGRRRSACIKIAPLICFETLSPELVADSVRAGGELLVNLTDLAWFHDSMIGDQMLAFATFRAVENARYFIFAANSGPSAVIAPDGRIEAISGRGRQALLHGRVDTSDVLTLFARWFR